MTTSLSLDDRDTTRNASGANPAFLSPGHQTRGVFGHRRFMVLVSNTQALPHLTLRQETNHAHLDMQQLRMLGKRRHRAPPLDPNN